MKLNKIYSLFTLLALTTVFAGCSSDDDYEWAQKAASDEVYFSSALPAEYVTPKSETSFTVELSRVKTADAITVPVTLTDETGTYTLANSSVAFAAGESKADIVINYNPETLEYDNFANLTLAISDANYTSEYGLTSYEFKAGVPAPWISLGKGMYRDDYVTGFFGVDNVEYAVEIQENQEKPGLYRLVNPYCASYPYNDPGDWDDSQNWYIEIDATRPDAVFITQQNTGMEWSYGRFFIWSMADYYMVRQGKTLDEVKEAGYTGTLENGIITFPANSLLISMSEYNEGGFYTCNGSGLFRVVLPGYTAADYSAEIETVGRLIDTKENGQAIFNVTLAADVAKAKVAFAAGKDPNAAYQLIADGDETVQEITASGEVRFAYDEPGDYVCLVVTYDDEGNEQDAAYSLINIPAGGGAETFTALFIGTYTHGVKSYSQDGSIMWVYDDGSPYVEEEAVLYISDWDENKYLISPWVGVGYDDETAGQGMTIIWNEDGTISVPQSFTGVNSSYGEIWGWDLVTAGIADLPSYYSEEEGFVFNLAWSVEDGDFGYTQDTYVPTAYASSPAKSMMNSKIAVSKLCKNSVNGSLVSIDGTKMNKVAKKQNIKRAYKLNGQATFMLR